MPDTEGVWGGWVGGVCTDKWRENINFKCKMHKAIFQQTSQQVTTAATDLHYVHISKQARTTF